MHLLPYTPNKLCEILGVHNCVAEDSSLPEYVVSLSM